MIPANLTPEGRKVVRELMEARVFPRLLYLGNASDPADRPTLLVNEADSNAFDATRGTKAQTTVTDQKTGKRYIIRHGSCGLPRCLCAAFIVREVK
jgi:hypothetical protein